ncbi:MFS transporter [Brevundimonas sp.]|uniref:MFS transporter n=1 Tax=Brevundimonas sp. TaxID=1871086 RepID=UPI00289C552A|nr:MFS transporter [Brevundimonas sp.]
MFPADARRLKIALFVLFFLPGVALASWITRTPAIREMLDVNVAEMGMVLFGMSTGAMTGVLASGPLISRIGARKVTTIGMASLIGSLLFIAGGTGSGLIPLTVLGLFLFGAGVGLCEIAINLEGAALERATGSHVLHTLHGCFSLGALIGAVLGFVLTHFAVSLTVHLSVVFLVAAVAALYFVRQLPPSTGLRVRNEGDPTQSNGSVLGIVNGPLLLIGLIVLAVALAEGSATDWLPILAVDEYGTSKATGSLTYMAFAAAVTAGRLGGGGILKRYGRVAIIRGGAVISGLGMVAVIMGTAPWMAVVGAVLWGLGVSMSFPLAISAAAEGEQGEQRVKLVAIMGYCAFLAGPPLLGLAGEAWGLRHAMLVVLGLTGVVLIIAGAARQNAR